jgi:hypothetical protein
LEFSDGGLGNAGKGSLLRRQAQFLAESCLVVLFAGDPSCHVQRGLAGGDASPATLFLLVAALPDSAAGTAVEHHFAVAQVVDVGFSGSSASQAQR